MNKIVFPFAVGFAAFVALSAPAQALNDRTWVSGSGVDQAGCGPVANPCRSLQYAYNNTNSGGEIDVKDSAGYGALDITGAISIVGDGSLAGVLAPATGFGIRITAGSSDKVVLRGLIIEGAGTAFNGVIFRSGGSLDIANCVVQNFAFIGGNTGSGILLQPTSGTPAISIVNTTVLNNGLYGININPTGSVSVAAQVALDHVNAIRNSTGITVGAYATSGASRVAITNSLAANNQNNGITVGAYTNASVKVSVDSAVLEQNGADGIAAGSGTLTIGRSVSVNNGGNGLNATGSGAVFSYKDNHFDGNGGVAVFGTVGTAAPN